jgi:hypothetical protein
LTQTPSILTNILRRLAEVRRLLHTVELQSSLLRFGGLALMVMAIAGLLELIVRFDATGRTLLVVAILLILGSLKVWLVVRPVLRYFGVLSSLSDYDLARLVGTHFPSVRDRLLNLLQVHEEQKSGASLYSPELIDASFQDVADSVREIEFRDALDHTPVDRSGRFFVVAFISTLLIVASLPTSMVGSFERLVHFTRDYIPPQRFEFEVAPGNAEVVKGSDVTVAVRVRSSVASFRIDELRLFSRLEGQSLFDETVMRPDSAGVSVAVIGSIRGSTEYFVQLENVRSASYRLSVIDRPTLRQLQVRLDFPAYSNFPPRVQDDFVGDVTALAGTRITVTGTASKELRSAEIVFAGRPTLPVTVRGQRFHATFPLATETSYHIEVLDTENLANLDPIKYELRIIPDEHPSVAILQPGRNIDLAGHKTLPMIIQAKDDFGVSRLRLGYRLVHSRFEEPAERHTFVDVPIIPRSSQMEVPFTWNLAPMSLVPEDVVEYFAEVFDNDAVNGPKSARSQTYLLRLPSLEEVFTELDRGHDRSMDELKQTMEEAKKLRDQIEAINQDLKQNKPVDWQQQKKAEELAKRYQELQKKMDEVKARVDEMVEKMQQQNVLSAETMEKYMELQKLFEELNSAELQQAMKQLQQAMQNVDRQKLQQAMQQLTFSEQRFRESIERTMNLLKRIQIEQKFDELTKRAQEIQQRQQELEQESSQGAESTPNREDLARRQEELIGKQDQLESEAADLQRRMEEFFTEMPADKLDRANEQLRQQQLGRMMQQSAGMMRGGRMQQSLQLQQQIGQQIQMYAEELSRLQEEMLQRQSQYVLNEMRRAINNLLELSQRQEALKQQAQQAPTNSPQLRQNAQDQMGVMQDLGNVIQGLTELSQRSFAVTPEMGRSIGEALARMQNAMRALDTRTGNVASQEQAAAMASLNKAATQVQNALQQLMQGGGAGMGGLMQQLQLMAGQQMGINMGTQGLGDGNLSMEQAAQAARLAMEQEAIRKSLEQLNREAQASGEQQRVLGDLGKIAEEMREVVENLQQQNVNPETIRKQERILSRMLDASRSLRERDYEQRRQGRTATTQFTRRSPADLDPSTLEGTNRLREDLLRALEQGYSKDYQELIRKYFEMLQKVRVDE